MNSKAQFAAFGAAFLLAFVLLYLTGAQWWLLVGLAVLALPVNVVLARRAKAGDRR